MKKAHFTVLILLCLCVLPLTVSAHPGKTDSSGGHRDRSTGEYHYHHGYSAHDHYDMDSDGKVDCPYDFIDKTDHSSTANASSLSPDPPYEYVTLPPGVTLNATPKKTTPQTYEEDNILPVWYFSPLFIIILILLIIIKKLLNSKADLIRETDNLKSALKQSDDKWSEKCKEQYASQQAAFDQLSAKREAELLQQQQEEISRLKSKYESKIYETQHINEYLSAQLKKALQLNSHQRLTGDIPVDVASDDSIPQGVYFLNGSIVRGNVTPRKPFGDFTVYVSSHSAVYHSDPLCPRGYSFEPEHVYRVLDDKRPCKKCGKDFGDRIPNWYQQLSKKGLTI